MAYLPEQHKIIAEVEINCALNKMTINDGIKIYNENGLESIARGIENYVKWTRKRLHEAQPAHLKAAETNAKAMFKVLFELGNELYIQNFISALEAEQELRKKPNGMVSEAIEEAKETLQKRQQDLGEK